MARGINWKPCGPIANVNVMESYRRHIYVDLPFDKSLPVFQALETFLEYPDGTARFPDAAFYYYQFEMAMKNAAHGELHISAHRGRDFSVIVDGISN